LIWHITKHDGTALDVTKCHGFTNTRAHHLLYKCTVFFKYKPQFLHVKQEAQNVRIPPRKMSLLNESTGHQGSMLRHRTV